MVLPTDLPDDMAKLKAIILAQQEQNARLEALVAAFKQAMFAHKSEKINKDQLEFALEDLETQAALVEAWKEDAVWMKKQPGYISTQLHKAVGESSMYLNYAIWDSVSDFRAAFSNPEFKKALSHYPSSAVTAPHLFEKVAVENCCVA